MHGNWGTWEEWSFCSKTCKSGSQHRSRFCNDPEPKEHGDYCIGNGHMVTTHDGHRHKTIMKETARQMCNEQNCPGKKYITKKLCFSDVFFIITSIGKCSIVKIYYLIF